MTIEPVSGASLARLQDNFAVFEQQVREAERLLSIGHQDEAALSAATAAWFATKKHPGVFASERLERVLHAIGAGLPDSPQPMVRPADAQGVQRVLNVVTEVFPVGGLTRMISRWIDTDEDRSHSIAVTRFRNPLPDHLTRAVARSGGAITLLNKMPGSIRTWAAKLRQMSRQYDMVILHIHCEDVVPIIAFAGAEDIPPVVLLNHADHIFWLGSSVCHSVLNLREAAAEISTGRRGIASERSLMLPTLVEKPVRKLSREAARAAIGEDEDSTVLISVARSAKYRPIDGKTYADRFVKILNANPKAKLYVIGSGMPDSWKAARAATGGRIVGISERPDPWQYFEAADIYVDSYPFSSSTSLMEAAGYGLPLVTLFKAPDEARLVGINHLGLIDGLHQARTEEDWEGEIEHLIRNAGYRKDRGLLALKAVGVAQPPEWMEWLERAYQSSIELPPLPLDFPPMPGETDRPHFGEPDIRHEDMYGSEAEVDAYIKDSAGLLDFPARLNVVRGLRRRGAVRGPLETAKLLMPEWIKRWIRG